MRYLIAGLLLLLVGLAWPADDGLVGHWRFDSAGPQVADLSGKGHTATLTGGQVLTDGARRFLHMDGNTRLEVPSAPDLCLRRGFAIEMRVRIADLSDGRLLAFKDNEYLLRVDWPVESQALSWFVNLGQGWEPRASAFKPALNNWYHLAAVWDGLQLTLWVNGLPYTRTRTGDAPPPTNNPLLICSTSGFGKGLVGDLEYAKVYNRALNTAEIIKAAYGADGKPLSPPTAQSRFDFTKGPQGWQAREGATVKPVASGLAVTCASPFAGIMHDNLDVDVSKLDYLSLRMAVDQGSTATLVFVTSQGAGRAPFAIQADGRPHTYVMEPWERPGWGGKLMLLGLIPSEQVGATGTVQYVRVTPEPEGEGELALSGLTTDATLPRAGRAEKVAVKLTNSGGPAQGVKVTLQAPRGVELLGPATQAVPTLAYRQERELVWPVRVKQPLCADFTVTAAGAPTNRAALSGAIAFLPSVKLPRASYVPVPEPVDTGPYTLWTHYCPLWKQGTHYGWKMIEPWPNRKPVLGWYNEGEPEVADWHIKTWLEHGISAVIYCWYRASLDPEIHEHIGHALNDGLLHARYLNMIHYGIMWENGCGAGVKDADDLLNNVFPYWLKNYFTHPSYVKIDGKPVLYVWVPGNVTKHLGGSDQVRATFEIMRQKCRERGLKGLYLVGCCGGADKASLERMKAEGWDATSAYGNGWTYPKDTVRAGDLMYAPAEGFAVQQEAIWKAKQEVGALPDITAAMMGWDARPWKSSSFYWADNTPAKFRDLCVRAKAVMDSRPGSGPDRSTIIFCCWNEFGEGHYIEPTRGYGFSYVDTIREVFTKAPKEHTDLAPEDVGLGPYDSWYRAAKQAGLEQTSQQSSWQGADLAQWSGMMGTKDYGVVDGVLKFTAATRDPAMSSPGLRLRGSKFTRFVVEMRVSRPGGAQVFWTNALTPHANESASAHATVAADGQFHRLVFEVGKNETWGGCLTSLRFDPTDHQDAIVEIKRLALE